MLSSDGGSGGGGGGAALDDDVLAQAHMLSAGGHHARRMGAADDVMRPAVQLDMLAGAGLRMAVGMGMDHEEVDEGSERQMDTMVHVDEVDEALVRSLSSAYASPSRTEHGARAASPPRYVCGIDGCVRAFRQRSNMENHRRTHTGERPFACQTCGKSFAHHTTLQHHRRIHGNQRPYVCAYADCGKSFRQPSQLRRHERVLHQGIRQHRCPVEGCARAFGAKAHLEAHLRLHNNEKPFVCEFEGCGLAFRQKTHLKMHSSVHQAKRALAILQDIKTVRDARELLESVPIEQLEAAHARITQQRAATIEASTKEAPIHSADKEQMLAG